MSVHPFRVSMGVSVLTGSTATTVSVLPATVEPTANKVRYNKETRLVNRTVVASARVPGNEK